MKQDIQILIFVRLMPEGDMYQGTNPSALRSREWITEALLALLEKEKYAQITVKDICRKADLSRQTFYQIFESKDEVMEYRFSELFSQFREKCSDFSDISLKELACRFFEFFREQRDFVEVLSMNNMSYLLEQEFERYLPQIEIFRRLNETEEYPDYSVCYVAGALSQILIHWYEKGMDIPVETIGALTEDIVTGRVFVK
ncbi:MAG: TetR/AcrR family transcriptional regulator [Lachnospiraceae bacterium]|nr:TetR/AcrR family transcriptional regulator [Lachnospiraceae bacterium]